MSFARKLVAWQRRHGRHDLPWQGTRDPYRIWLSEVMLQQTQVSAAIPYYRRFLEKYPSAKALARASEEDVLKLWSGLGYYARGRNLHKAARLIARDGFPRTSTEIQNLPGVGRSTAAAIAAFAFGERAAILDGNVERVLSRAFMKERKDDLWTIAGELLPRKNIEAYTQALMDLGATVCTRVNPRCGECPLEGDCLAHKNRSWARFPAPRAKRTLPLRKATWWVLLRKNEVLMEKRPGAGLWGGLLSFPETVHASWKISSRRTLPVIEHGFTHFRLHATPIVCDVRALRSRNGQQWLALERAGEAPLPTPVKKVLLTLVT